MRRMALGGVAVLIVAVAATLGGCGGGSGSGTTGNGSTGGGTPGAAPGGGATGPAPVIQVLSNRADLISGGNALVRVALPAGADAASVKMTLNGQDVTPQFAMRPNHQYEGLLTGMVDGTNTLVASVPGSPDASTVITNHPNGGPVFSGPQIQPWSCQKGAVDAQCNQPATYTWLYKSTNPTKPELLPYDPKNPPADVAMTTTQDGTTVPFIVRVETGYQDRDQYKIAVLYQPGKPWQPWAAQPQWNHKLLITGGFSCGVHFGVTDTPSITNDYGGTLSTGNPLVDQFLGTSPTVAMGLGFAVMATALDHDGHNCNIVTQAESLVMAKEHLVESYGTLRYTIGTGCSGGSLLQYQVANAYPGIYQGILPQCSFPDAWSSATQIGDFHLLNDYFNDPKKWGGGVVWNPLQQAAVEGNILPLDSNLSDSAFFSVVYPTNTGAGVPAGEVYDPKTNPGGVRTGLADYSINFLGPREPSAWGPVEKQLGHGFAGLPIDNVGVQYGLRVLQLGLISNAQFLDLNKKIGGVDIDIQPTAARFSADQPALANAYRSGAINEANNLKDVAIIDLRGPDPGIAHDAYRSWAVRARLMRAQGNYDNQVIWFGAVPVIGDPTYATQGLLAMDRWLSAVEKDSRDVPLSRKIANDKPGDITDRCTQVQGVTGSDGTFIPVAGALLDPVLGPILNPLVSVLKPVVDPAMQMIIDPVSKLVCGINLVQFAVQMRFETPRMVAGDAITTDANKCQLKPLDRSDRYGPLPFTDAQWKEMQALFPDGVCDYSVPGVSQQPTIAWQGYGTATTHIYGGEPLPPAPENSGGGWASPAFGVFQPGGPGSA